MDLNIDVAQLVLWATILSVAMAAAGVIALPWVVTRLPSDYFCTPRRNPWRRRHEEEPREPLLALALGVLKNIVGALLLLLGFALLFMPGQGVLTILVGLMLMNFPGKYRVERWLVSKPGVMKSMNWMRQRGGSPPFDPLQPLSSQTDGQ